MLNNNNKLKDFSQYEPLFNQVSDERRTINCFELQDLLETCLPNGKSLSVEMDFEKNYLHHPKGLDSGIVHIILDKNQHSFKSSFADPTTQKIF